MGENQNRSARMPVWYRSPAKNALAVLILAIIVMSFFIGQT